MNVLRATGRFMALVLTLRALTSPALAQSPASGAVFLDRNGNGTREPGEPGIAGVVVSNQVQVVRTDGSGGFHFAGEGYGLVVVSVPNDYKAIGPAWKRAGAGLEFALSPAPAPSEFTFIHASDTHLDSASLPRMKLLRTLVDSIRPDFVIITGDLIRDALRVSDTVAAFRYELYLEEQGKISRPVWTAPGNHEIFGIERDKSQVSADHPLYARKMYRHYLGPDYYSFNYGGVHFVALNSEDYDDQAYYGHIDSVQVEWLKRDLAVVPDSVPVVTFNHIPFFTAAEMINGYDEESVAPTIISVGGKKSFRHVVSNAGDLLKILRGHRYPLALGGHIHIRETLRYALDGQDTRFEQAAAVVGPSEADPLHFRSGITVYRVRNREIGPGEFVPLPDPPEVGSAPDKLSAPSQLMEQP
jgi:Icc protein